MCRQRGPEGMTGRPCEQFGIFGHGHDATEGGVDVSEVVLQGGHLLSILLCGEDLWGKLSQLRRKYEHQVYLDTVYMSFFSGELLTWDHEM